MPKLKTHKGLAKRIKVTGTGKIVRHKAGKRHILEKKTTKRKRGLRKPTLVTGKIAARITTLLSPKS